MPVPLLFCVQQQDRLNAQTAADQHKAKLQGIEAPAGVFVAAPLALDLLILLLGLVLIGRSLRIEPILLLNAKE